MKKIITLNIMQNKGKVTSLLTGIVIGAFIVLFIMWLIPNKQPSTCADTKEIQNETRKLISARQSLICERNKGKIGENVFGQTTCNAGNEIWTWEYDEFVNPQSLK